MSIGHHIQHTSLLGFSRESEFLSPIGNEVDIQAHVVSLGSPYRTEELILVPDYYRLLEVHTEASPEVIERAYKALSLKYHPDKNPERQEWATGRMAEINEAYAVLSNAHKRRMYDLRNPSGFVDKVGAFAASPEGRGLIKVFWSRGLLGVAQTLMDEDNRGKYGDGR